MEYHIEYLNQQEVYIVAESPIGFRRWMIEYSLEKRPQVHHELGGVMSWALTRDLYFDVKDALVVGERPVPDDLMEKARRIQLVSEETLLKQVAGKAYKRP
jgi:hypothetical protein